MRRFVSRGLLASALSLGLIWVASAQNISTTARPLGAVYSNQPSNPTGTTDIAAFHMMGLGGLATITPVSTGRVRFMVTGNLTNNTNGDGARVKLAYGTGTAPANADAVTGTVCANTAVLSRVTTGGDTFPFALSCVASSLPIGTAHWFDLQMQANTGGTAAATNLTMSANEE